LGGIPELVEHGRTGLLVPPGDPAALAAAMAALARHPGRAAELGRAARQRVAARHDLGGHADALLDCYRRAIARAS
jgi:glycosyltransferase involved in cell wall biosynthesis